MTNSCAVVGYASGHFGTLNPMVCMPRGDKSEALQHPLLSRLASRWGVGVPLCRRQPSGPFLSASSRLSSAASIEHADRSARTWSRGCGRRADEPTRWRVESQVRKIPSSRVSATAIATSKLRPCPCWSGSMSVAFCQRRPKPKVAVVAAATGGGRWWSTIGKPARSGLGFGCTPHVSIPASLCWPCPVGCSRSV